MILSKNLKQTISSLLIIGLLSSLAYWIIGQGDDFAGSMIVFLTMAVAVGAGALLLILRLLKFFKKPTHFLYNYFGILNLSLALIQVLVIPIKELSFNHAILIATNLLLGVTMLFDIYKKRNLLG